MQYKYAVEHLDYSDYSSGRVFYSLSGHPAFPIRLASEVFQRCVMFRKAIYETSVPCTLYDPCCGAAYHLSVLAYLHSEHLQEVIGSDVNEKAVELAKRNLGLLNINGLDKRIDEISKMIEQYGKESHQDALRSAHVLKDKLLSQPNKYLHKTKAFQASALNSKEILDNIKPNSLDIVFTDVPYGQHSQWQNAANLSNPLKSILDSLLNVLSLSSVIAIASDKQQKVSHESYQRLEQFQIGKRRVVILKPI
jgi:23S rRNA (guanine2535-N1)-methyltransferase